MWRDAMKNVSSDWSGTIDSDALFARIEAEIESPEVEVPEVLVFVGLENLMDFLKSENWWGPENHEEQLTVPHVIITAIHPSWKEASAKLPVQQKKEMFYRLMLPLVMHANMMVENFRSVLEDAREDFARDGSRRMRVARAAATACSASLPTVAILCFCSG